MAFKYSVRKDGRLMKRISINGKVKTIYAKNVKDLENKYIELKYQSNNGIALNNENITFRQYAENWFELNCTTKELRTQEGIKNRLKHCYDYFGNIKLKNLKPYHIQGMVTEMAKNGFTDLTKRCLAETKRVLEDAVNNDFILKNVANGIKAPKYQRKERLPLSLEEDRIIYNVALTNKYGLFILTLRYCGLRPEEIIPLTTEDINIEKKTLHINKAVTFLHNQPIVKSTKNKKTRDIPIPDFLFSMLQERINYCKENNIKYLFTKETKPDEMLSKIAVKRHLEAFLTDVNKTTNKKIKFTLYQLRHSYCTMLYYAGIKIKKAQALMGHSSADMVYDIYTHLDEERENAEELIENYISQNIVCQNECQNK